LGLLLLGELGCSARLNAPASAPSALRPRNTRASRPLALHVAGDSTAAEFPATDGRVGWGAVLESELTGVRVHDAAKSGRSSRSFRDEGHWGALLERVAAGDWVLIQFGHNDPKDDPARHTDAATSFRDNLRRYVTEVREHGGVPVLLTSIARRRFEADRVQQTHGDYPEATRAVAHETGTPLIDMTIETARLLERYGPSASERLFAPEDNTHLSPEGAHAVARLVVAGLLAAGLSVTARRHDPSLMSFPARGAASAAVVVCPGGGYTHLSLEKEGTRVAAWLNERGVHAFVLRYRLADWGHPAPLADVQSAIRLVRAQSPELGIPASRIGVLGFSAGGHLAACASCLFEGEDERPDFAILSYPVITFEPPHAHEGSRRALLGLDPDPALVTALSMETRVTARTPPTFLWHTKDDASVPVQNSLAYTAALQRAGVPHELHVYETGPHGLGMSSEHEAGRQWPKACEAWLAARGLIALPPASPPLLNATARDRPRPLTSTGNGRQHR
jgi:acetyl esterase/lipase